MTDTVTTKISRSGLDLLRLIAAATDEKHYGILSRLLLAEAKRLNLRGVK